MPLRGFAPGSATQQRVIAARSAAIAQRRTTAVVRGPFLGYMPDIDPNRAPLQACSDVRGLIRKSFSDAVGEVLTVDDGFARIDPARLPLGTPPLPSATPQAVVGLDNWYRAGTTVVPVAITVVPAGGATGRVWQLNAVPNWAEVTHTGVAASSAIVGSREFLFDGVTYPPGSATRKDSVGAARPIAATDPPFIFCNGSDPVYVAYTVAGLQYEELVLDPAAGGGLLVNFIAQSVETFAGRTMFLNTSEAGIARPRRLRWTPVGNCDVDTANVGAGAMDFHEFGRRGLRAKRLGNLLACYFEDGVALVQRTGIPVAPFTRQYVSSERGLVSTHAVCEVDANTHFGIFTDGWFEFSASGNWREVGLVSIDGIPVHKWKSTFYRRLRWARKDRLTVNYDPYRDVVRIALPTNDADENAEVWIYDRKREAVWLDNYQVTQWGSFNATTAGGALWGLGAGGIDPSITWATVVGSWASFAPVVANLAPTHGTLGGLVFIRAPELITFDGVLPNYLYRTHRAPTGADAMSVLHRFALEYVNVGVGPFGFLATSELAFWPAIITPEGASGEFHTSHIGVRLPGQTFQLSLAGAHPAVIRGWSTEVLHQGARGQT